MNDDRMKQRIKDSFETDVPDVLSQIKADPNFFVPEKPTMFRLSSFFTKKVAISLMTIFVIALVIIGVNRNLSDPVVASTVTLDVNPSIIITLDEDDYVISVSALNDDGETVVQRNIKYRGLTIEEVVDILITRLESLGYIVTTTDETNVLLIEVSANDDAIRTRVETAFQAKLEHRMGQFPAPHWVLNARDIKLTDDQQNQMMQDHHLSMYTRAKMTLIYRITILDNSYTIEDLLPLTVRELYALFISLEDPDNLPNYNEMPGHRPNNSMPFGNNLPPVLS